jgi:hypothetical protein
MPITSSGKTIDYAKGALSAWAALLLAEALGPRSIFREISSQKQTGLGAGVGPLLWAASSPFFWILVVLFFASFFAASRLKRKPLRISLFWIPTLLLSTVSIVGLALFTFAFLFLLSKKP